MNWHTKTAVAPQVTLRLDMHPPVLDISGQKQTSVDTVSKSVRSSKKIGGFGGQWLNSLCSMYHTLRSGTSAGPWVAMTGHDPVVYEVCAQSHYQYDLDTSRLYEPSNRLWYPAPPGGSQQGYFDPLVLWDNPYFPSSCAPQPCNLQLPQKFGISRVDHPLNPEAKEWIPRDYLEDHIPSSLRSKETSEVECLEDELPFNTKGMQDPPSSGGSLDFCEITDHEVDAVRFGESSNSLHITTSSMPQSEKELTLGNCASHVDAVCNNEIFSFDTSQNVKVLKVEKERFGLSRSESHTVVVPNASSVENVPSNEKFSCDSGNTEVYNCDEKVVRDTSTFSYASIVGKNAVSPMLPTNAVEKTLKKANNTEYALQPIPRIFLKDRKYPKEKAAPTADNKINPILFKSVNKSQKKCSRNFLKELRKSSPVAVGNSDSVGGKLDFGSPNLIPTSPRCCVTSSETRESPVITSPKDRLTYSFGSPFSAILKVQHSVSESSSSSSRVRSTSESSIASVESSDIEFGDVIDRTSAAPDVFVLNEKCQPKTSASPKYSSNILAHILGCDDSGSESSDDESEDWDDVCTDSVDSLGLDDSWETFGLCITAPESTKIQTSQSSSEQDLSKDFSLKLVYDTVDEEDLTVTQVSLEEINRRWEQEVEHDVMGISERKVNFGEVTIYPMIVWAYACKMARRGPWEEYARDRVRFSHRIATIEPVISSVLQVDHREKVYQKLYGQGCSLS